YCGGPIPGRWLRSPSPDLGKGWHHFLMSLMSLESPTHGRTAQA
ncbi:hypothetical protein CEXT_172171, partial [Caerostris extrusa]